MLSSALYHRDGTLGPTCRGRQPPWAPQRGWETPQASGLVCNLGALLGLSSRPSLPQATTGPSPGIAEPGLQGVGEPRPAAVVPKGARLALVLAGQAWGRGVRPRRAWHWDARSPGAEEAQGADVIPRESRGLHLCSQREARKGLEPGLWPQAANTG